jgi:RHS repeat-associated protein
MKSPLWMKVVAAGLAASLVVTMADQAPAGAAPTPYRPPRPVLEAPVPGYSAAARIGAKPEAVRQFAAPPPVWPAAGVAEVAVPVSQPASRSFAGAEPAVRLAPVRAGNLPVWIGEPAASGLAPAKVRVELLDRATAAKSGAALISRLSRVDGQGTPASVRLRLDYSGFASAFGADWADRLRLVARPECALTTPQLAQCQATALRTSNDGTSVAADVSLANSTLVSLEAGPSSGSGDYSASSLSAASVWSAGGSSGDFSWSYPIRTPPALGGPAPTISFAYSSQSVDGRMAASNNQPSWVGEGFEYWPGYIERRYVTCSDDMGGTANNTTASSDQCWKTDNATLSLGGNGGELIYNAAEGRWHPRNDDASRVQRFTGTSNGDNDGEYWVVTTANGTRYYFGLNRLAGWTTGKAVTNSVLTSPVYGNNPNEPCHATSFSGSSCTQAWRWNLDYVVDPHGNTMSYWYVPETNLYGRNNSTTDVVSYVRAAQLQRIDYGTDQRTLVGAVATDTEYTGDNPTARVLFTTADRCLSGCATHDATHWPDTPWDLSCSASPCQVPSPTFWTTQRLASVKTQVWGSTGYRDVESYTLTHTFPDPGDGTRAGLWLDRISHTGLVGGTVSTPDVTFTGIPLNNRVDTALANGLKPMNWRRIKTITTESGELIDVTYSPVDCVAGSRMPGAPESNTLRCFPVRWTPPDPGKEIVDYFHKYVVTQVVENDLTEPAAGSPLTVTTAYEYAGTPAWHYTDDDGLTKDKYRTWSEWRGYGTVRVRKGTGAEQTLTENRYFRGMDGDHLPSGARTVSVADSKGLATISDIDGYAGLLRESITYNGPSGPAISGEVNDPVQSGPTATRTINNVTVNARYIGSSGTHTWVARDGGRPDRFSHTSTQTDNYGMPTAVTDYGDDSVTGDEQCTLTDYVRNTSAWLATYPSRARTYALTCAEATQTGRVFTAADIIGETRTSYDNQSWGTPPTAGNVTAIEQLKDIGTYVTVARTGYDAYGRGVDAWDVDGNHVITAYTPTTGGPVTRITTTSAVGWQSYTDLEPAWGATVASVDPNNRRTDFAYDALGRVTGVWVPGRNKAANQSANTTYTYTLSNTVPNVVATAELNAAGGYITTYALFDALLRPRQRQIPADGSSGGRIVTDTFYDTAGRAYQTYGPYYAGGSASATLFLTANGHDDIPLWNRTVFDGAARATDQVTYSRLAEKWRTSYAYTGDRTDTTPPTGGASTSTLSDAFGRMIEQRQYHGRQISGTYDSTTYTFDRKGQLTKVTAPDGVHWDYGYDLRGQQTSIVDPDKGQSTMVYDDAGRIASVTDARNVTLAYQYDALGRRTGEYLGTTSGTQLAAWTYDGITGGRGLLSSSTRYVNGAAYTFATTAVDAGGRPTQQQVTIPSTEGALAGTYTYARTYRVDGTLATTTVPAIGGAGGLPQETLTYGYNALGKPSTLSTSIGSTSYVSATSYTQFGETSDTTLRNAGGPVVDLVRSYEDGTHRLVRSWLTRETNPATLSDLSYTYDAVGNITKTVEAAAAAGAETQCFGYDYVRRLTGAWTPSSGDCTSAPSAGALGGPAPYWLSWTFDVAGNRLTQVNHATAGNTTSTYTYPQPTQARPHGLLSSSATGPGGSTSASYGYDTVGNTTSRPGNQTLTWDVEGHLASVTEPAGTSTFVYDADGGRLIRHDPQGSTLYLAGQELRVGTGGQVSCVRYYSHRGQTIAMRTPAGLTWLLPDDQGTAQTSVSATTQASTRRWQTPYGATRGSPASWPNDRGFVDGTQDNTGLTHLGAREYDPGIGRFISVDPAFDNSDPQQMEGYTYAGNNPVVYSDPTGLMHDSEGGSSTSGYSAMYECIYGHVNCGSSPDPITPTTTPQPKPESKKCGVLDVKCRVNKATKAVSNAYHATVNWVDEHKAEIAGFAVAIAIGSVCTVATFGMGALGCAVVAGAIGGAIGSATTYGVEVAEGKHSFDLGDFGKTVGMGAVVGAAGALVGYGAGKLAAKVIDHFIPPIPKPEPPAPPAPKPGPRAGTGTPKDIPEAAETPSANETAHAVKDMDEVIEGESESAQAVVNGNHEGPVQVRVPGLERPPQTGAEVPVISSAPPAAPEDHVTHGVSDFVNVVLLGVVAAKGIAEAWRRWRRK